jgi:hypothetical protein
MSQTRPTSATIKGSNAILASVVLLATYLLLTFGVYSAFTSQISGGNDFYPRWRGSRAFILEGRDPYSDEVTSEIQWGMYGRLAREDEDQVAFAYPLYVLLFVLPFALLPYPLAQACWISGLVVATLAALILTIRALHWQPPPVALLGLGLWVVLFYPSLRSIILGQFSIMILALIALAVWALHRGNPSLAGCSLALTTVKPQMVFLIVPFLLSSAWVRGYRRAVVSFFSTMAILIVVTSAVLPTWIPSFLSGLVSYGSYTSIYREGRSPLGVLINYLVPTNLTSSITTLVSIGLLAFVIYAWSRSLRRGEASCGTLTLIIVVTLLLPAQTGTTNQVLLLLPILNWLAEPSIGRGAKAGVSSLLLFGPWLLFLLTFAQRNGEHAIVSIPLPLAAIGLLWWVKRSRALRQERTVEEPASPVLDDRCCRPSEDSGQRENLRT